MQKLVRFDWAIKYLLRNKANFDILEGFLSELLKKDIYVLSILESESNKNDEKDKFNRVDLIAETKEKERIIIEVQCTSEWDYLSRVLYGASKVITEHLKEGQGYKNICKVISVSIVFFNIGQGEDYIYEGLTVFKGRNKQDILKLNEHEQKMYESNFQYPADIYPEFHIIKVNQFNERIRNKLDEWVYFLKNEKIKPTFQAKGIHSAAKKLDVLHLSEEQRKIYERYQDDLHYQASMIDSHYGMGKQDGYEQAVRQFVLSLKKSNVSIADIAKYTGLSQGQITTLKLEEECL